MSRDERTRTKHDEWTKDVLALWLEPLGKVQLDARIAGSVRRGDVLFREEKPKASERRKLGLLGGLARGSVLFEPFAHPVTAWELETCLVKAIEHTGQAMRATRRAKRKLSNVKHTALCVITPTLPDELKEAAGLTHLFPDEPGVYRMARLLHTVIVVVTELSEDPSTLWLRLLGPAGVKLRALRELDERYAGDPIKDATLKLLLMWYESLPPSVVANFGAEDAMNWLRKYELWEKKTIAKGKLEGELKGKLKALLLTLEARGLSPTAYQRKQILACTDVELVDQWVRAAVTVSDVKSLLAMRGPKRGQTPRRAA